MKRYVVVLMAACYFLSATAVGAQGVTQLSITSETGEYVGQGQTYQYDGSDVWQTYLKGEQLQISVHSLDNSTSWTLMIAAPQEQSLGLGTFPARSFPGVGIAAMGFSGNGRSCPAINGTLTIRHLMFSSQGEITEVWLSFEQRCEGDTPALRGELMMNIPLAVKTRTATWGKIKTLYR